MVLGDGGDDHVVGIEAEAVGEVVDGLGGVAADDGDVVAALAAGEARAPSRASSYAAVAIWDLYPAPRCTLEYHGRNCWTRSATAGSAAVEAAESSDR